MFVKDTNQCDEVILRLGWNSAFLCENASIGSLFSICSLYEMREKGYYYSLKDRKSKRRRRGNEGQI